MGVSESQPAAAAPATGGERAGVVEAPRFAFLPVSAGLFLAAAVIVALVSLAIDIVPGVLLLVALAVGVATWLHQDASRRRGDDPEAGVLRTIGLLAVVLGAVPALAIALYAASERDDDLLLLALPSLLFAAILHVAYVLRRGTPGPGALAPLRRDWGGLVFSATAVLMTAMLPFFYVPADPFIEDVVIALAYVVMALGLNIIVGFAGLLDLGYVAFFAIGAYTAGWLMSGFFADAGDDAAGIHVAVAERLADVPGIHLNFLLVLVFAIVFTTIAGMLIGLPTLRLRGDYIAIVTLAFGEIIGRVAINGDALRIGGIWEATVARVPGVETIGNEATLTRGRQGITPVDKVDIPFVAPFESLNLRPWFYLALAMILIALFVNFRLRDSRLGRAWIALREDEVAAASMGIPLVRTKLLAYGTGAAFGGISGAFLASYLNTVNADQFQFSFSIFVLGMVILGGLGSIWGVVVGAIALSFINNYFIPDVINDLPRRFDLDFDLTELSFGIFGFLLVIMMIMRPEGLIPERRRQLELADHVGTEGEDLYEARA
jgi:branched-chain amino acid transport system permease protein